MSTIIEQLERGQMRRLPPVGAGDRVRVHFQVVEGSRRRTQVFEGIVLKRQGHGVRETFTVRKQSFGVGVERTFPFHSPKIEKIEVASRGDVPNTSTEPEVGVDRLRMRSMRVVLPAPFGPTMATISPGSIVRSAPRRAYTGSWLRG